MSAQRGRVLHALAGENPGVTLGLKASKAALAGENPDVPLGVLVPRVSATSVIFWVADPNIVFEVIANDCKMSMDCEFLLD